ncbi:MAG: hypothetical protein EXR79_16115 [Myxococcales bacterium]|nr:hypothetical protein [Myxococcales bacterium]
MDALLDPYRRVLERCEPFLIAHDGIARDLRLDPLGVAIPPHNVFNPQHRRHAEFLAMLQLMDRLTFGPFGMEMPSWVFYDCAVMPGAVFGLAIRAAGLEPWAREALRVPDGYTGLVPVSQCIAIPVLAGFEAGREVPDTWLLYTLESLNQVSPGIAPASTLRVTFALGLQVFPIRELIGITQWRAPKLPVYADLGPLELLTAYTPAHSMPRTLSFRIRPGHDAVARLLRAPVPGPPLLVANADVDADDAAQLIALQREIEAGRRICIVGHPSEQGPLVRVPLWKDPAHGSDAAEAA